MPSLTEIDAVIALAGVVNDPSVEFSPVLSWETNALGTMCLADAAARAGVKQFIYVSSGSIYGVKDEFEVT
jgi:nucleoside-diphosphate-sugar epimerase